MAPNTGPLLGHPTPRVFAPLALDGEVCQALDKSEDYQMGFGKDGKGVIIREDVTITVGALAAKAGILQTGGGIAGAMEEDFRLIKSSFCVTKGNHTNDEGALLLGLADGELTLVEIEEAIELNGPVNRSDHTPRENAERPVWLLGSLHGSTDIVNAGVGLTFVPAHEHISRWTFSDPDGWRWFVYNEGPASLTSGTIVSLKAQHFGVWVT